MKRALILVLSCVWSLYLFGYKIGDFEFGRIHLDRDTRTGTAILQSYEGGGSVEIPSFFWYPYEESSGVTNWYHVTVEEIGDCAFTRSSVTSVSFPGTISKIGDSAFLNCSSLNEITFSSSVDIARLAFSGCTNLSSTSQINSNARCIEESAFSGCVSLKGAINITCEFIGAEAFRDCSGLTSVHATINGIGCGAFMGCVSIRSAEIEGTNLSLPAEFIAYVGKSGSGVFNGCTSLETCIFGDGVVSVGCGTFSGCTALREAHFGNSVSLIEEGLFCNLKALQTCYFPGAREIRANAFNGCTNLSDVTSLDAITTIGASGFAGCSSLSGGVNLSSLTQLGNQSFKGCVGLTSVKIGAGLSGMGHSAFMGCVSIRTAEIEGTNLSLPAEFIAYVGTSGFGVFNGCSSLETCIFGDGVVSVGCGTFSGCTALREVHFGNSVSLIEEGLFSNLKALQTCHFPGAREIGANAFNGCTNLTDITSLDSVTAIRTSSFAGCSSLAGDFNLAALTQLGNEAFKGCVGLTSIKIGSGLSSIGHSVFMGCTSIQSAEVDGSNLSLPAYYVTYGYGTLYGIFNGCIALETCTIGNGVTSVGCGTFSGCSALREVYLGNSVSLIEEGLFSNLKALQTCYFPGAREIGANAFNGCTNLTDITSLDSVTAIRASSFAGCSSLEGSLNLSALEQLGEEAFRGCTTLTGVRVGAGVNRMGNGAFMGCTSLKSAEINGVNLSLPEEYSGYTRTIYGVFKGCSALETCVFGDGVVSVGWRTFSGCDSLREVNFGNGVSTIADSLFSGLGALSTCHFPGVCEIGANAFNGCTNLTDITSLDSVTAIRASSFAGCSSLGGSLNLSALEQLGEEAFRGCTTLTGVRVGAGVNRMGNGAFMGCTSLKSAEINGVDLSLPEEYSGYTRTIYGVFKGCSALETCVFGDGVVSVGWRTFSGCDSLREVYFGNGVSTITDSLLRGIGTLEKCQFPGASEIGPNAFNGCTSLAEISPLENVVRINDSSFSGCSALTGDVRLVSATYVGANAFNGCSSLTGCVKLAKLPIVNTGTFRDCKKIAAVKFGDDLSDIRADAFYGSTNLVAFSFGDVPPTADNNAFRGVKTGAFGVYPASNIQTTQSAPQIRLMASENSSPRWEDEIDPNGIWKKLIMCANKPILTNDAYNVVEGSIHLNWEKKNASMRPTDYGITYEVRRGFTDSYESAEVLTNGYDQLAYEDKQFDFTGGVSRIWYWVKPEHQYVEFDQSDACRTRNRYCLVVGFSTYGLVIENGRVIEKKGFSYGDAMIVTETARDIGGFGALTEIGMRLTNDCATLARLDTAFNKYKEVVTPGDIFLFYIATHGNEGSNSNEPSLDLYHNGRSVLDYSQLSLWSSWIIEAQSRFIGVIMACNSQAMVDGGHFQTNNEILENIETCGLRKCGAYASLSAWITSCNAYQRSFAYPQSMAQTHSIFSEAFCVNGWTGGYADEDLFINGKKVKVEGHNDGRLTFLELAQYAQQMYVGVGYYTSREWEDEEQIDQLYAIRLGESSVQIYNTNLLSRIDVGMAYSDHMSGDLATPTVVFDLFGSGKIYWESVPNATQYRVYRVIPNGDSILARVLWRKNYFYDYTRYSDDIDPCEYYVQAVNPAGISKPGYYVGELGSQSCNSISRSETRAHLESFGLDLSAMDGNDWYIMSNADLDGDGIPVWQEVITGVSPIDATSQFTANITIENGEVKVFPNPDLGERRVYTTYGKKALDGNVGWVDMATVPEDEKAEYHFFKIGVSLP